MQTEQLLCWSGMTNTEHSTTYGSNEKKCYIDFPFTLAFRWVYALSTKKNLALLTNHPFRVKSEKER